MGLLLSRIGSSIRSNFSKQVFAVIPQSCTSWLAFTFGSGKILLIIILFVLGASKNYWTKIFVVCCKALINPCLQFWWMQTYLLCLQQALLHFQHSFLSLPITFAVTSLSVSICSSSSNPLQLLNWFYYHHSCKCHSSLLIQQRYRYLPSFHFPFHIWMIAEADQIQQDST